MMKLRPSLYDYYRDFSVEGLKQRLERWPYNIATQLTIYNISKCLDFKEGKEATVQYFSQDFSTQRELLKDSIEEILPIDNELIKAVGEVKRHLFVRPEYKSLSYCDNWLPYDKTSSIGAPGLVALSIYDLEPEPGQEMLEVGSGSGYHAALVSEYLEKDCRIYGVEINEDYQRFGEKALLKAGYENITTTHGDGVNHFAPKTFDRIYVPASFIKIPPELVSQLKEGGIIQGVRRLDPEEVRVASERPAWNKYFGKTYEDYLKKWRHSTAISTYRKEDGELLKLSDIYDVWYVPLQGEEEYAGKITREEGEIETEAMKELLQLLKSNMSLAAFSQ